MKCTLIFAAAITLMAGGMAMGAATYITATRHNFNADGYSWADGQICKPCHTPHHAVVDGSISSRLWNHQLSGATYTPMVAQDINGDGQVNDRAFIPSASSGSALASEMQTLLASTTGAARRCLASLPTCSRL